MRKKFIALLSILLFLVIVVNFRSSFWTITGYVSDIILLSINIANTTQGRFIYFSYPDIIYLIYEDSEVILSENASFIAMFQNTGNLNITARIEIHVLNSTFHHMKSYYDDSVDLATYDIRNFSAVWRPNKTGTYWVIANTSYSSVLETKKAEVNASFEVIYGVIVELRTSGPANEQRCAGEDVDVTNRLWNAGISNATGNLTTKITHKSTGDVIYSYSPSSWTNVKVSVYDNISNPLYKITTYTINETNRAGWYEVFSNFSYNGRYVTDSFEFKICKDIGTLTASPDRIDKTIARGGSAHPDLTLRLLCCCEETTANLSTTSGAPGNWTTLFPSGVYLKPIGYTATNTTTAYITVPIEASEGTYKGTIYAKVPGQQLSIPLIVRVSVPVVEANVELFIGPEGYVCLGDNITANVTVTTNEPGNVNMTYQILDPDGVVVVEENETVAVSGSLSKNVTLTLPYPGVEGYYTFVVIAEFKGSTDTSSATFLAIDCVTTTTIAPTTVAPGAGAAPGPAAPATTIKIEERELTLNLSKNLIITLVGRKKSFIAYVNNTGTDTVTSVRILIDGIPLSWVNVTPLQTDIAPGDLKEYLIRIDIPWDASTGTYELRVKASDEVESNTETVKLIIGKDIEELAKLSLEELEKLRAKARESLLVEECCDVTKARDLFEEAELAREKGLEYYVDGKYQDAINWFEHAMPSYERVVSKVDITLEMVFESLKTSKILMLFIPENEHQFELLEGYLKSYKKICEPILMLRKFLGRGIILWLLMVILIIFIILLIILLYKEKRRKRLLRKLKKMRERLRGERSSYTGYFRS